MHYKSILFFITFEKNFWDDKKLRIYRHYFEKFLRKFSTNTVVWRLFWNLPFEKFDNFFGNCPWLHKAYSQISICVGQIVLWIKLFTERNKMVATGITKRVQAHVSLNWFRSDVFNHILEYCKVMTKQPVLSLEKYIPSYFYTVLLLFFIIKSSIRIWKSFPNNHKLAVTDSLQKYSI